MNFKTKIEALGNTFNLHSNSTKAQEVWTLNWLQRENLRVTYTHIHHFTMMLHLHKIIYIFPFVSNQLSNWLAFGPFQLGLSVWLVVGAKGTNKTLAPMGLGLFCQLLTSPKLPLTIFNTTI